MFQFSAYGKPLEKLNVDQFSKLVPPIRITLEIVKQNSLTKINIFNASIQCVEEMNVENDHGADLIKINFMTSEKYSHIKKAIMTFKINNSCKIPDISLAEDSSNENNFIIDASHISDDCKSVSESLSNIIAYSLNTNFRKTCYNLFKNRNETQTIQELIKLKLSKLEDKKTTRLNSDDL